MHRLTDGSDVPSSDPVCAETDPSYYRARYYDPSVWRFLSQDPIGIDEGTNFYAYVGNDPTNSVDPLGLAECFYSVRGHLMMCWPNKGGKPIQVGPSGVHSGAGSCQDNPSCENARGEGPITPGRYRMNFDTRPEHQGWGDYRLEPWPHHFWDGMLYKLHFQRGGFELHIGSITFGCINADKTNPEAVKQFHQMQQLLQSEDGSNFLTVF
jgi:RHS repeat-associated protein